MAKKIRKGARKKFFEISIPLTASKAHLYGYSPEDFNGKTLKLDMSKNLRGKGLELKAKIEVSNEKLNSELLSLQIFPSHIRRSMRRGADYVEDSFETFCKDAKLRIKPFMITRKRVSRKIRKVIRETAKKHLEAHAKARSTKELFSEIMTNKLQKELSLKIKKIYPLALCEIRMLEVVEKLKSKEKNNSEEIKEEAKEVKKEKTKEKNIKEKGTEFEEDKG